MTEIVSCEEVRAGISQTSYSRIDTYWELYTTRQHYIYSTAACWISDHKELPVGLKVLLSNFSGQPGSALYSEHLLIEFPDCMVHLDLDSRKISVQCASSSKEICLSKIEEIREWFPEAKPSNKELEVDFWYKTNDGPISYTRRLTVPDWNTIKDNYPEETKVELDRLMGINPEETPGKLILWYGPPGTGKSYGLRSLGNAWRDWCSISYILDPELLLTDGTYLIRLVLGNNGGEPMPPSENGFIKQQPKNRWRLLVLEDTGELLTKDAKLRIGQGLSRLLNLSDGLLGQGLNVMVLITTNEEVGSLHEAASRPGRCLSNIGFDKFSASEAAEWLERHKASPIIASRAYTLAELYDMSAGDHHQSTVVRNRNIGVGFTSKKDARKAN